MGKGQKSKGEGKRERKDIYERLCYLFEAGYTLVLACPSNTGLICSYGHMITMLAKKNLCKLYPHIKRHICKKCHLILRPGLTSKVMLKNKKNGRGKHTEVTCQLCGTKKRFLNNPNHKLFIDKEIEKNKNKLI
ncbi:ribonuclease P protein subunit p21 [Parasteatoda tepidariorum]|nr:ribonuclease P protein subunit p21-like [Parasteatoda tepidariorum]